MKTCNVCNIEKESKEFYLNPTNNRLTINRCKTCVAKYNKARWEKLKKDPVFISKERERGREKHFRLGYNKKREFDLEYSNKNRELFNQKFPEKIRAYRANTKSKPTIKGNELHHWSYCLPHVKDTIELPMMEHKKLHRYIIYDQEQMMYRTLDGVLLDTKESHISYYNSLKKLP